MTWRKLVAKLATGAFATALTLTLFIAGPARSQEPIQLTFTGLGGPEELAVFEQLVASFNAANPDIVVTYEPIPGSFGDYITALNTAIAGGTAPDIAYIPDGNFYDFAQRGLLVNLQPFVDGSENFDVENVWPSALGRYRWDEATQSPGSGDLYALPKDIGPTVVYVNLDLFEEAGVEPPDPSVPLTWDQVVEIGTRITRDVNGLHPDEEGFDPNNIEVWGVGDVYFENIVYGNGGRIISEDGRTFAMPEDQNAIDALQWISDLNHVYNIRAGAEQEQSIGWGALFETGRTAMTTAGRFAVTGFRERLEFNWDVIPNFVSPSGEVTAYPGQEDCTFSGWSGSVGLSIIRGTEGEANAEAAYRFIEYLAGPTGQSEQAALGFAIPNQIDVAQTDVFLQPDAAPASAEVFIEAARCELPGPWTQTPLYGQWFDDNWWGDVWQAVVNEGVETAEDALLDRADVFQDALDEAWASVGQ